PENTALREVEGRLRTMLGPDVPRTLSSNNPALQVDLSAYPRPEWHSTTKKPAEDLASGPEAPIRFFDVARSSGLNFSYFNSAGPGGSGVRMFETTGGGVAVLDYDA